MNYTITVKYYEDEYFEGYEVYCLEIPVATFGKTEEEALLKFIESKKEYYVAWGGEQ